MPNNPATWDFFLAHATADKQIAESLYGLLSGQCRVFLDTRTLRLGDDWDMAIPAGQRRSAVTVVLVSANTDAAYFEREEVAVAIALARKDPDTHRVVPIYFNIDREDTTVPYGLRLKVGIELGRTCSLADAAGRLLDLLKSLGGGPPEGQTNSPPQSDAVDTLTPRPTWLAFAQHGLYERTVPMIASVCVVTGDASSLIGEVGDWKARILRDTFLSEAQKAAVRKATLADMFAIDGARSRLLEWLAVTSFSAYLYFGKREALNAIADDELGRRFLVEPVAQRLRKKREVVERVLANETAMTASVDAAVNVVQAETSRQLPPIAVQVPPDRASAVLVDLALLVARASADHLATPESDVAATLFASLRTRVRYAYNVATHERHTRDKNPLP